jgi:hypothetical protein
MAKNQNPYNPGTYTCPACKERARIEIRGGSWYWARHDTGDGVRCKLSDTRLA